MRPDDRDLQRLGPFPAGVNNLSRETSVPGRALREAVNVDLSDDGKVRRRDGYTLVETLESPSALFGAGRRGFVAAQGTLYAFEVEGGAASALIPIQSGLRLDARLAVAMIEPHLFVSDGDQTLRIAPDNTVTPWTPPTPPAPATMVVGGSGSMPSGRYRIALTYRDADGVEGPASQEVIVATLADADQLRVLLFNVPAGYAANVYMTKPNGSELLLAARVPAGATSVDFAAEPTLGRPCPTVNMQALPAGEFALYYRGRLWVAFDEYLVASAPFQYTVAELDHATMPFSEQITGVAAAGDSGGGFFVGQESKVYYVSGNSPNEMTPVEKYPFGMVPGTLAMAPGAQLPLEAPPTEPVPIWLATNGVVCVGLPDGSVLPLSEKSFAADVGATGAAMFLQRDGESRYVATTAEPRENSFALRDEVAFEIIRNGIPVSI